MKTFLSFASEDRAVAERIQLALLGSGMEVFFDKASLPAGSDYNSRIRDAIDQSDFYVFLVSPRSIGAGRYVHSELELAKKKWPKPWGHVLPVVIESTNHAEVDAYLAAVTLLEPHGDIAAEVAAAIAQLSDDSPDHNGLPGIRIRKSPWSPSPTGSARQDATDRLNQLIKQGKDLLRKTHEHPPSSSQQLNEASRKWHKWRKYTEQSLFEFFTSDEPLRWLKELRPRHLEFSAELQILAKELPQDVQNEVAYLQNLLERLDNYDEAS